MLQLAASLLVVAATGGDVGPPVSAAPPLTDDQKRAADHYVKEGYEWTHELTSMGETLGNMLVDVLEGKQTSGAVRAELKRMMARLRDRCDYFKARPSPDFAEMIAFRKVFVDYLLWNKRTFPGLIDDALKIAENRKLSLEQRSDALLARTRAGEGEQKTRAAQIESAMKAVYAALNRR